MLTRATSTPIAPATAARIASTYSRIFGDSRITVTSTLPTSNRPSAAIAAARRSRTCDRLRQGQILGRRDLDVRRVPFDEHHGEPRAFDQRGLVGRLDAVARTEVERGLQHAAPERLRRLGEKDRFARQRLFHQPSLLAVRSVGSRRTALSLPPLGVA